MMRFLMPSYQEVFGEAFGSRYYGIGLNATIGRRNLVALYGQT
jgi:hypothetical protein